MPAWQSETTRLGFPAEPTARDHRIVNSEPEPCRIVSKITLEDYLAFQMHLTQLPENRAVRRRREITFVLYLGLCALLGVVLGWLLVPDPPTFSDFISVVLQMDATYAIRLGLTACAVIAVTLVLSRLYVRRRTREVLRRILKARPDVDPADPTLAHGAVAAFVPEGIKSDTAVSSVITRWPSIRAVHETPAYLFFVTGPFTGVFVPKRTLPPEQDDRLRALMKLHLPGIAVTREPA